MIRLPDRPVAGVDGCPSGWLCVVAVRGRPLGALIAPTISALAARLPGRCLVAIDMPIGLPVDDSRRAEACARKIAGPRRSSVFPVPLRAAITARSREEACRVQARLHRRAKRIGVQTWAIVPKIRELDAYVRADRRRLRRIIEIHPEVSFRLWQGAPIAASKKSAAGRAVREALIDRAWPAERQRLAGELRRHYRGEWRFDDLNDAFAALWSAIRYERGRSRCLPPAAESESDALGLPMRIVG